MFDQDHLEEILEEGYKDVYPDFDLIQATYLPEHQGIDIVGMNIEHFNTLWFEDTRVSAKHLEFIPILV